MGQGLERLEALGNLPAVAIQQQVRQALHVVGLGGRLTKQLGIGGVSNPGLKQGSGEGISGQAISGHNNLRRLNARRTHLICTRRVRP